MNVLGVSILFSVKNSSLIFMDMQWQDKEKIKLLIEHKKLKPIKNCNDAIIGVGNKFGKKLKLIYCYRRLVNTIIKNSSMTFVEAVDHVDNVILKKTKNIILDLCLCSYCKERKTDD